MGGDGLFFIERHNEIVTSFTESAKGFQITLKVGGGEWITRTLISWPSKITVIKPLDLCLRVEERIASALRNYQ
jgi:predicted DNA-binding transcriptional regulator YafY